MKKVHRVFTYNQKAWLKPYIDTNIEIRENGKNDFQEDYFKLMNGVVFGKNHRKSKKTQRYQTCNKRSKKELFGVWTKLSYKKFFCGRFISNRNEEIDVFLNKLVYLGLTILEVSNMGNWNIQKKQNYVKRIQITL